MIKPRIFIGSATETIRIANNVQQLLNNYAEITVWNQGVFFPSKSIMNSLEAMTKKIDFAIFVFTPTDINIMRNQTSSVARDNVIFELGLFAGQLGIERCFIIRPTGLTDFHFPTDLLGLVHCEYDANRSDGNLLAALGSPCNSILSAIEACGGLSKRDLFLIENNIIKSFPTFTDASALSGYWLSKFEYVTYRMGKYVPGFQFDIEYLQPVNDYCLVGSNLNGCSPSGKVYLHDLKLQLFNNYILGQWFNVNSKNTGSFQLSIDTHLITLHGAHLGNANDLKIHAGSWVWIKLNVDKDLSKEDINAATMKSAMLLNRYFKRWAEAAMHVDIDKIIKH